MRTQKGDIVSQYELHDAEKAGLIKIDLLADEALDKERACIDLLCKYNYAEKKDTLRETYENIIGVYKIERDNPDMWKMIWENKIFSIFQMDQASGVQGIALTKPKSVEDLATLNSYIFIDRGNNLFLTINSITRFNCFSDFLLVSFLRE